VNVRLYRNDPKVDSADQEVVRVIVDVRSVVIRGEYVEVTIHGIPAEEIDADEFIVCVVP
jgi:hypothetical protein